MSIEFEYRPNEIDSDQFISEVSVNLLKENIKAQFKDPLEYRKKDHIIPFIAKYQYSKDNADAYEEEDLDDINDLRDEFYNFMQTIFKKYLNIGIPNFSDYSEEEQDDLIHYTYRFFIVNIRRNFVCFVLNYINMHRDSYEIDEERKKDVTSLSFKKEVTDPVDVYILSNLHSVIKDILHEDISVDDFLENCDSENCLETQFVTEKFDDLEIVGNFVESYIDMIDDDFVAEIETKIRNKILKKYKKK